MKRSTVLNTPAVAASVLSLLMCGSLVAAPKKKIIKPPEPSALDRYIQEALGNGRVMEGTSAAGSLWNSSARLSELGSDIRATQVNDLVTVVVSEQASAVVTGDVNTSRASSVNASVTALFAPKSATGALSNLAASNNKTALQGQGETSQGAQISTTVSARITHVLPNGYLVLEGTKDVQVSSEAQHVVLRGIIRPADLTPTNVVSSTQIAQMELKVNGKGVIGDAIRRPNFLYRLFLGLLPF
jgi:flagellar L-ring protein precursor FlgH